MNLFSTIVLSPHQAGNSPDMAQATTPASMGTKAPNLSFVQIVNMSVGFLGIQFGWALQMANMGPIYEYLGAEASQIPFLFLAAPLTGLLVQPIIGYMSDRTWHPLLGRRRPYFLVGAILSSLALVCMPNVSALWMAAGLLWILDSSINISMEPFRAFVTDKLNQDQRTTGFAMQSLFIGLGSVVASALPWMLGNWFNVSREAAPGSIPDNVKVSFYIGAVAFFGAVLYTIITSKEYPPADLDEPGRREESRKGFGAGATEIVHAIRTMPTQMRKLALVQFFTWPGLFLMWFYYSAAVARHVFGAASEDSPTYGQGVEFAGLTLSFYNAVTFCFALVLPILARKVGRPITHMLCLIAGAVGLLSVGFIHQANWLFLAMTGVGIAWASILSMPYSMLSECLPANKVGIYMGIFNFFIVLPEIIASLFFGYIMDHWLNNDRMLAVQLGGVLMLVAAVLCLRVKDR
jgi:maltose/moltooligosaccharide transporter